MGTLGNKPAAGFQSIEKQSITGNGGTSYALDHAVTNVNDLEVFVNNVRQEPTTAYTLSGQNIVMSEAIANTDSFYVIYQSRAFTKAVPADTSVTTAMLQDNAVTSAKIAATNGLTIDNNGATVLTVDRGTSAGTTIDVQKDGASMATIGSSGSAGFIVLNKNNTSGVGLFGSTNNGGCLLPTDGAVNTPDNAKDLGRADIRWRNIYLSGGAYIGGTAAANHLDDYETGSFQLTMTGESSGSPVGYGIYTKVGNMCHFNWYSGTRTISSVVAPVLSGLPFTHTSPYGSGGAYASVVFSHNTYVTNSSAGYINIGTTSIYPTANNSSGGGNVTTGSKYVMCSGSYYCD